MPPQNSPSLALGLCAIEDTLSEDCDSEDCMLEDVSDEDENSEETSLEEEEFCVVSGVVVPGVQAASTRVNSAMEKVLDMSGRGKIEVIVLLRETRKIVTRKSGFFPRSAAFSVVMCLLLRTLSSGCRFYNVILFRGSDRPARWTDGVDRSGSSFWECPSRKLRSVPAEPILFAAEFIATLSKVFALLGNLREVLCEVIEVATDSPLDSCALHSVAESAFYRFNICIFGAVPLGDPFTIDADADAAEHTVLIAHFPFAEFIAPVFRSAHFIQTILDGAVGDVGKDCAVGFSGNSVSGSSDAPFDIFGGEFV